MIDIFQNVKSRIWDWPEGLIWKYTEEFTVRSRRKKFELFMSSMQPTPDTSILDIGVSDHIGRATNYLEMWYPYPEKITALGVGRVEDYSNFRKEFPEVNFVLGDGRNLDFPDNGFDIVFSNAVVEHVGSEKEQRKFISEITRVGKRIFITTPNYWFPLDAHTLIPFAHWLPQATKFCIYKKLGREYWADLNHLNLLSAKKLCSLFPEGTKLILIKQRSLIGIAHNLIIIAEKG